MLEHLSNYHRSYSNCKLMNEYFLKDDKPFDRQYYSSKTSSIDVTDSIEY